MLESIPTQWLTYGIIAVLVLLPATFVLIAGRVPIKYNLRNLLVRWRITFITALAFTVVVGLLTVLLAFVNGMYRLTETSGQPGNVMVLSDGATDELFSNLAYSDTSDLERRPGVLVSASGKPLCSREVYIIVNQPLPRKAGERERRRFVQVRGIIDPAVSAEVHGLALGRGAWFSGAGVEEVPAAPGGMGELPYIQCVMGDAVARELGPDQGKAKLEVGDTFELGPRKWKLVGLILPSGSSFDSEIWAKQQIVGPLFGKERYTSIVLSTPDAKTAEALSEDLTKNYKKAALQAQPETEYYSKLSETNRQFLVAIMFVAGVMAIGGVFGIMNTMFAAISQRTKDIGVLRILGYSRWQVLVSFFLESMVIAFLGGLLGLALGYLSDGMTASSIVSGGQGGGKTVVLELDVDSRVLSAGLVFTLAMGFLGGLLPSLSAMRVKPLEALR